ncbi:hypothetical protein PSTT_10436 [Puccinia striiformis]|uniref:Uncharacterized protein n=1 Tax=Puccinia striiformis TaxID=27350 RepID=A0A2S4V4E4_9BASI|nr:hypothetical protein PSTT_10436 [Puccinia striiformis]
MNVHLTHPPQPLRLQVAHLGNAFLLLCCQSSQSSDWLLPSSTDSDHQLSRHTTEMNNRSSMPPPSGQPVRAPPTAASQPKRKRRTKAEMVAYRADGDAREKHRVAALKLAQNQRTAKRTAKQTASASQSQRVPPTNSQSQPAPAGSRLANSRDVSDGSPLFQHNDYGLVCTYLENPKNFTEIHGNGSRTTVGPKCITKGAAYERFAIYMNDSSRSGLTLNGKLLRQRIVAYKKKFFDAKKASNSTGEGTLEGDQFESYDQKLEDECRRQDGLESC